MSAQDFDRFVRHHLGIDMHPWQLQVLEDQIQFHKKWEWDQWNEWAKRQIQISDEIEREDS
jgi:hypothetical protein